MKAIRIITLIGIIISSIHGWSQAESHGDTLEIELDMLSAPQSPAANLLGFSESEIIKPENPTDFMISFQNATNNFAQVPSSFAADFRLWQFFKSDVNTLENVCRHDDPLNNIKQTTIISLGYKNFDDLQDSLFTGQGLGIGFKLSILRGANGASSFDKDLKVLDAERAEILKKAALANTLNNSDLKNLEESHKKEMLSFDNKIEAIKESLKTEEEKIVEIEEVLSKKCATEQKFLTEATEIQSQITIKFNANDSINELYRAITKKLEEIEFRTYGFVFDIAGGVVINFPDNRFNYSLTQKASLWATLGYEAVNGVSFLTMLRSSYNNAFVYKNELGLLDTGDLTTYDFGARLIYDLPKNDFSISAELVLRGVPNSNFDLTNRMTLNFGYKVRKNARLTFVFGKDFDGNYSLENNLISALNLTFGLGSKKQVLVP